MDDVYGYYLIWCAIMLAWMYHSKMMRTRQFVRFFISAVVTLILASISYDVFTKIMYVSYLFYIICLCLLINMVITALIRTGK